MASKDRALNDDEIKAGAKYIEDNFFNQKNHKDDLTALRLRRMVDLHSLTIGYLVRCGYSVPRAVQIADYMRDKDLLPPEPDLAALASEDE